MTWALLGGPEHGKIGDGGVPEGYVVVGADAYVPLHFPRERRDVDFVYRWHEDAAYIADGHAILENWRNGAYAVPAEFSAITNASAGLGFSALDAGISLIANSPDSNEAQRWRETIDLWRKNDLV